MPPRMRYPARLHSPRPAENNATTDVPPRDPQNPLPALAGRGNGWSSNRAESAQRTPTDNLVVGG